MEKTVIDIPSAFQDLMRPMRLKGYYGGRGGAKSESFCTALLIMGMQRKLKILCGREYQNSIGESVKSLLDKKIEAYGFDVPRGYGKGDVKFMYESLKNEIRGSNGTHFIFHGFNHKPHKIKSLDDVDICWVEEANVLSQESLDYLLPTIRNEGSEIWFSYNRRDENEPVHDMLKERAGKDALHVQVNHDDNPFFPDVLRLEMERDEARDINRYDHIWLGNPWTNSEAQVFHGKYQVMDFDTPDDVMFHFGADFGFSVDPSTLVRFFINHDRRQIYIDYEAYAVGVEIEDLPAFYDTVPESRKWMIVADSARPDTISYLKKQGFRIKGSKKGKDSIVEGVEFIKNYDVFIHPRCKHTINEFTHYSYKVEPLTGNVTPILIDNNNHIIDPIRYGLEDVRHRKGKAIVV